MQFYFQFCQLQLCKASVFSFSKHLSLNSGLSIRQTLWLRATPVRCFLWKLPRQAIPSQGHWNASKKDCMGHLPAPEAWVAAAAPPLYLVPGCLCLSPSLSPSFSCVQIAGNLKNSQGQCFKWLKKENRNNTSFSFSQMSTFGKKEGREGRGRKSTTLCFPEKK